MGSKAHSV